MDLHDTAATGPFSTLKVKSEDLRKLAARAAKAAVRFIHQENARRLPVAEGQPTAGSVLAWDPRHSGTAPSRVDVRAKDVAWAVWEEGLERRGIGHREVVAAGEEAGSATREIVPDHYVVRQDSLDGTTNAARIWDMFSSVQLVDQVRSVDPSRPRARHLAGAISCSNGWTISWCHWSTFNHDRGEYQTLRGAVYYDGEPWGVQEHEVTERKWDRTRGTVASVASTDVRMTKLQATLSALGLIPDALYNLGGTPMAPALIAGDIDSVIEPNAVSLHDSALLIPHQILGGEITYPDLRPMNYLRVYEESALQFEPDARPIPGYIAWGGAAPVAAPATYRSPL